MSQNRKQMSTDLLAQAKTLHKEKHLKEAIATYRDALATDPDLAEAHCLLGNALLEAELPNEAVIAYKGLVALQPDNPIGLNNLSALLLRLGDAPAAIELLLRAVNISTDSAEIRVNLAKAYIALGQSDKAIEHARTALKIRPDSFDAYYALGFALHTSGQLDDAFEYYSKASALRPADINVQVVRAQVLERTGKYQQCWTILKPLLRTGHPDAAITFFDLSQHIDKLDEAVELLQTALARGNVPAAAQSSMHFKLGKHFDDIGKFDDAFSHYSLANRLAGKEFDLDGTVRLINDIISVYNNKFVQTMSRANNNSRYPIFILGMPRSGTSLVEQILACHPEVAGGGELPYVNEAASLIASQFGKNKLFPTGVASTGKSQLQTLADRYLQHVTKQDESIKHATNKMPHNFLFIGLIMQMLPGASIIHCTRNPLDTCLSCYFSQFWNEGHGYSYELSALGKYYRQYSRLMDHWNELFGDRILTVPYETLVANQEPVTRDLLEYCGLEWDERCLDFHKSKRTVYTLSYEQVRKPLYSDSINRWRNYEHHLGPLRSALEGVT